MPFFISPYSLIAQAYGLNKGKYINYYGLYFGLRVILFTFVI